MVDRNDVIAEARALAAWKGVPAGELERALELLAPLLGGYAELVVAERGIEIITGGVGASVAEELAAIAASCGAPAVTLAVFAACAAAFPSVMLGVKVCLGGANGGPAPSAPPTLYVRTLAPREEVLRFLAAIPHTALALDTLAAALAGSGTIYGLGFSSHGEALATKTYTIGEVAPLGTEARPGFVSYRVVRGALSKETKRYVPDVAWNDLPAWAKDAAEAKARVACDRVGHLGVIEGADGAQVKLYLERIGAIPSDFSAR